MVVILQVVHILGFLRYYPLHSILLFVHGFVALESILLLIPNNISLCVSLYHIIDLGLCPLLWLVDSYLYTNNSPLYYGNVRD